MRLIDADAYIAEIHNRQEAAEDWIKSSTGANQIRAKAAFLAYCKAALTLKNMPTIDAVPVVRCADCSVPHNWWTGCPKLGGLVPPPEFYCAFGERKDGEMDGGY